MRFAEGVQRVGAREEFDAGHVRHPLVGDQERNGLGVIGRAGQLIQRGGGPVHGDDARVVAEAPAEVGFECREDCEVGGDQEDDRPWRPAGVAAVVHGESIKERCGRHVGARVCVVVRPIVLSRGLYDRSCYLVKQAPVGTLAP
jgi:hypothetical protein